MTHDFTNFKRDITNLETFSSKADSVSWVHNPYNVPPITTTTPEHTYTLHFLRILHPLMISEHRGKPFSIEEFLKNLKFEAQGVVPVAMDEYLFEHVFKQAIFENVGILHGYASFNILQPMLQNTVEVYTKSVNNKEDRMYNLMKPGLPINSTAGLPISIVWPEWAKCKDFQLKQCLTFRLYFDSKALSRKIEGSAFIVGELKANTQNIIVENHSISKIDKGDIHSESININTHGMLILDEGNLYVKGSITVSEYGKIVLNKGNIYVDGNVTIAQHGKIVLEDGNLYVENNLTLEGYGRLVFENGEPHVTGSTFIELTGHIEYND